MLVIEDEKLLQVGKKITLNSGNKVGELIAVNKGFFTICWRDLGKTTYPIKMISAFRNEEETP